LPGRDSRVILIGLGGDDMSRTVRRLRMMRTSG
jgi:hypothetical protein